MDPQESKCYAKAQRELQELFREISSQGQVGAVELQSALLPFTAGDVRKDVLELIEELKHHQHKGSVDEQEFIRVMWKKMYLNHLTYSSKCRANTVSSSSGSSAKDDAEFNIPLAHVIVSIKRRSQLRQFADYYASRGISGADYLTAAKLSESSSSSAHKSPRHHTPHQSPKHRRRVCFDRNIPIPVALLRAHTSSSYSAVACVFDPEERVMKTTSLFPRGVRGCQVTNCSKLYCLLFSRDVGNYVLGSTHFAQQVHQEYQEGMCRKREECVAQQGGGRGSPSFAQSAASSSLSFPAPIAVRDDMLIMTKLEDFGLRNVVTATSSRSSFVACTERKIHQWSEEVSGPRSQQNSDVETVNYPSDQATNITIDLEEEGDCFGVLGGRKLLTRTKNIADASFVKQLSAGDKFAMAVTATGDLFTWGEALLGHRELSPWKTPWFGTERVARVACGLRHVLVATESGCGYSWGSNLYGQLGHGWKCSIMDPPVSEPVAIKTPGLRHSRAGATATINNSKDNTMGTLELGSSAHAVLDVACGDEHSVILLGSGQIFAFGNNWQGQLGVDPETTDSGCVFAPTEVSLPSHDEPAPPSSDRARTAAAQPAEPKPQTATRAKARVYLISAYGATTAAVTADGGVFVWGKCIPSGLESVCGLVSRWGPQLLDLRDENNDEEQSHSTEVRCCRILKLPGIHPGSMAAAVLRAVASAFSIWADIFASTQQEHPNEKTRPLSLQLEERGVADRSRRHRAAEEREEERRAALRQ